MARRKQPNISDEILDQLLAGVIRETRWWAKTAYWTRSRRRWPNAR
jgi:hypothetical protein